MSEGKSYLTTTPGSLWEYTARRRQRPCWRCRFRLRWPPGRKHWQCRPAPRLVYLDVKQP